MKKKRIICNLSLNSTLFHCHINYIGRHASGSHRFRDRSRRKSRTRALAWILSNVSFCDLMVRATRRPFRTRYTVRMIDPRTLRLRLRLRLHACAFAVVAVNIRIVS